MALWRYGSIYQINTRRQQLSHKGMPHVRKPPAASHKGMPHVRKRGSWSLTAVTSSFSSTCDTTSDDPARRAAAAFPR